MLGLAVLISSRKMVPRVGLHELAELVVGGAGEGAGDMAEQLAFKQRFGKCAAGDFDKGLVTSAAAAMDGAGDQRLAGAAFAGDEYGGLGVGNAIDHLEDSLHAVVVADHILEAESHVELLAEDLVFFEHTALADGALEGHLQLGINQWLGEEIERAAADGVHGHFDGTIAGDEDHRGGGDLFAAMGEDVEAVAIGEAHVAKDDVGDFTRKRCKGRRTIAGGIDFVTLIAEPVAHRLADVAVVVDQEQGGLGHGDRVLGSGFPGGAGTGRVHV